MPEKFIIDTNIYWYGLEQSKSGEFIHHQVRKFLSKLDEKDVLVSGLIFTELLTLQKLSVLKNKQNDELNSLTYSIMAKELLSIDLDVIKLTSEIKARLSIEKNRSNRTVDWFIASHCLLNDCTLVTGNKKDFELIPSLKARYYDVDNKRWFPETNTSPTPLLPV